MANFDVGQAVTTDMAAGVGDYEVDSQRIDEQGRQEETYWDNTNWSEYLGYYKTIPELKKAVDALAMWTVGKGYKADSMTEAMLSRINGWGEDSIQNIFWNMIVVKKINGDSYAEIIRNDRGTLINLKPLNPFNMRIVINRKGIIARYEEYDPNEKKTRRKFMPNEILHLSNDRLANEIHGTSVVEACKWVINARNEAMTDWRKVLHRNLAGVRIIYVDEDDTAKLAVLKTQWKDAIDRGEVLILPKGTVEIPNIPPPANPENWIRYLGNFFYEAVGVPKVVIGGSQEYTEASSKVGYLTFEQPYMTEQRLLEQDLWQQAAIRLEFVRPVSLKEAVAESEKKNTGQVGFQPTETEVGMGRTE